MINYIDFHDKISTFIEILLLIIVIEVVKLVEIQ